MFACQQWLALTLQRPHQIGVRRFFAVDKVDCNYPLALVGLVRLYNQMGRLE